MGSDYQLPYTGNQVLTILEKVNNYSFSSLKIWEIVQSNDAVTLNYILEDGSEHTDMITFDANGYPISITHDGVTATGTWTEAASSE